MDDKKQTPVEWLFLQLYEKMQMKGDGKLMDDIFEKAKLKEQERLLEEFSRGYDEGLYDATHK